MVPLPPDLSRLGDELTAAAGRALEERRRRRRLLARSCACALSGILTFAVLAPAALSPGRDSLLAQQAMDTVLARPPDRPPVLVAREAAEDGAVLARPPDRPPVLGVREAPETGTVLPHPSARGPLTPAVVRRNA